MPISKDSYSLFLSLVLDVLGKKVNSDSVVALCPGLPCLGENGANTFPFYPSYTINRMQDTGAACGSNRSIISSYSSKIEEVSLKSLAILRSICAEVERQALSLSKAILLLTIGNTKNLQSNVYASDQRIR